MRRLRPHSVDGARHRLARAKGSSHKVPKRGGGCSNRETRNMFKVTQAAAEQVRFAAQQGGAEGMALRLAAARKTDGTFDYKMGFDQPREEDIRFSCEGVDIVMEPEYVPMLEETVLDYVELEQGDFQFIFLNPKDPAYQAPESAVAPPKS